MGALFFSTLAPQPRAAAYEHPYTPESGLSNRADGRAPLRPVQRGRRTPPLAKQVADPLVRVGARQSLSASGSRWRSPMLIPRE